MDDNELLKNQEEFGHPGGLIGAILQQSLNNAHASGLALHEYEKERADKLQSEIDAIRWRIQSLFEAPYQPSNSSILAALWPSEHAINDYLERDML